MLLKNIFSIVFPVSTKCFRIFIHQRRIFATVFASFLFLLQKSVILSSDFPYYSNFIQKAPAFCNKFRRMPCGILEKPPPRKDGRTRKERNYGQARTEHPRSAHEGEKGASRFMLTPRGRRSRFPLSRRCDRRFPKELFYLCRVQRR